MLITNHLPYSDLPRQFKPKVIPRTKEEIIAFELEPPGSLYWMLCTMPTETMTMTQFEAAVGQSHPQVYFATKTLLKKYRLKIKFLPPEQEPVYLEDYVEAVPDTDRVNT